MRILMLAPQPFFEPRGTPISVYQRLEALSALGHDVDLATYHVGANVNIPRVTIYRIPSLPFIKEVKIGPSWAKPVLDILLFFLAVGLLLTRRYDTIHSHEEAAFFAIILSFIFRTKHVYDMHSSLPVQLSNFNFGNWRLLVKLFELLERWTLYSCDAVLTIDAKLEDYVRSINPQVRQVRVENQAILVSQLPVDLDLLEQLKNNMSLNSKQLIVYTGTFERYQGLDLLLDSAKIVKEKNPRAHFILVGGKPQQIEQWRAKAKAEQVAGFVDFVGIVPPEEAIAYLAIADVLVSPRTNGTSVPLKIYSYLHSGKAIVATQSPAHTQVLNQDTAVLVEPSAEAMAEGILILLADPNLRIVLVSQARRFAKEKYHFGEYVARIGSLYGTAQVKANLIRRQIRIAEQSET